MQPRRVSFLGCAELCGQMFDGSEELDLAFRWNRWALLVPILALMLTSAANAALEAENLLTSLPSGFKVGYSAGNGKEDMVEYVPAAETVDDWTKMVTVQVFHNARNVDPDAFAAKLADGWKSSCAGGDAQKITTGAENGYPIAVWAYDCPLNPQTGKPESMWLKVTSGSDALYSVQYAYRLQATKELATPALDYLQNVIVRDTRRSDRPCPKGM